MEDDCLLWKWGKTKNGYGAIRDGGRLFYAHRFYFEALVGVIRRDKVINHLCGRKACVNPRHLEVCDQAENVAWSSKRKGRR